MGRGGRLKLGFTGKLSLIWDTLVLILLGPATELKDLIESSAMKIRGYVLFAEAFVQHLPRMKSHHFPVLIQLFYFSYFVYDTWK